MSGFKDVMKGGWHPKGKDGGNESWRSDNKGVNKVAGWMGKGKDSSAQVARDHQSAPLSTLKDPDQFGPPPKHVHYHGAAAAGITASPSASTPDHGGLGAPLGPTEKTAKQRLQERREAEARAEEEANKPPPGPFRADTTGLNTAHLPKPPVRRAGQESPPAAGGPARPPPRLPPRLPPRQNSHPDVFAGAAPPPYTEVADDPGPEQGLLNSGAMKRLGRAGVAVPGFNIGPTSPPVPPRQNSFPAGPTAPPNKNQGLQHSEVQSRLSKLSTSQPDSQHSGTGTTWAEKQAALKTAGNLRNDPSKVTLSDMRSAASTANNFRERHGEQAAAGFRAANSLNQRYRAADRVNNQSSTASPPLQSPTQSVVGKKAPPPPPPKKKGLIGNTEEPPPVPLNSKPKF